MNNEERYVRATNIRKIYDVSYVTLRRWAEDGKIRFKQTKDGGKRLYCINDIYKLYNRGRETEEEEKRTRVCYARVSSAHQKEDLERQVEQLKKEYPSNEIIKDIGSGLNWSRKGFTSLLDRIVSGTVEEVVVAYKDRLCRFGYELIEQICKKFNTKLLVLNKNEEKQKDRNVELSEDLLSIVNVFVARNNGLRAGKNRHKRKEREGSRSGGEQEKETENDDNKKRGERKRRKISKSKKNSNIPNSKGEGNLEKVDGNKSMGL